MTDYVTKDSGERAQFESGMQRDTEKGKPRFDLMLAEGVPYEEQMITRFAKLLGRGAEKYNDRNWEQADSDAEMARMKSSAFRHFMQWMCGETDEDHAAGAIFNILAFETTKYKVEEDLDGSIVMAPLVDGKVPDDWQDLGYVSEDGFDAPARPVIGDSYGPPPPTDSAFINYVDVDSVSKASEMVKQYRDAGYTAEEAEQIRLMHPAFAPDQEQVKEQIQVHINKGVISHAGGSVARLLADDLNAIRGRMAQGPDRLRH